MIRTALATLTVLLCTTTSFAQNALLKDKASTFFDDSAVREIRIYFDDPNWYNTLVQAHQNQRTNGDPYFPCRFKYGNIDLPKVGVRFKGNSSFGRNGIKRPFKFDFNEYDDNVNFLGLKKLNLHTNDLQPDFMREKLFTDFASKFVTAVRNVHVRLYVNDAYYGLYTAMEQPDKTMMESRFGDDEDGNLYEGAEILGAARRPDLAWLGSNPDLYRPIYELETNEEANDYSGLIEFIDILNNTPAAQLQSRLESVCDVEQMLTWVALNNLFVNLDSYIGDAGEYYIYDRSRDGKFVYVQWDHNESFGTTGDGTVRIANPFTFDIYWLPGTGAGVGTGTNARPLLQKTIAVEAYKRLYLRIFARLLREGFNVETFSPRITQLANLIREHVYADPNKVTTNAQFETALNNQTTSSGGGPGGLTLYGLTQFVRERFNYMRPFLNSQALPTDVRLNEVVAVNNGAYKDTAGDADPWVEIHNLGPGPVTLTNFYLTDDQANPTKWAVPEKTLADGEFLVVWLDGETGEGDTHANFKPQTAGGKLYIYQVASSAQTAIDSVAYPAATAGQTYIRLGSYGDRWQVAYQPTPGIANPVAGSNTSQPPTQGTGLLLINEIMADNEDTYVDPQEPGVYEDWFEVFNPGTTAVDMSGMYITDNLNNPTKWKVPNGVTIPAHGYLVFVADGEAAQGNLHTSWSLSADGESIGIYQTNGTTLIDAYTFSAQQGDVSIGRTTDGDGSWSIFQPATPGVANVNAYANNITSAASFLPAAVSANSIVSLFGQNLTAGTVAATSTPLPTALGGVTITVTDSANVARDAPLFFVSAGQVNFQVPAETANGRAKVAIRSQSGATTTSDLLIKTVGPGLFAANASGQGTGAIVALRISATGVQTYLPVSTFDPAQQKIIPVPISLGAPTDKLYLILNGTGVRGRPSLSDVEVEIGGVAVPVIYAGAQGDFVGLDQVNVGPLPNSLTGKGEVQIVMTVDNKRSNRVTVTIQ
jgi:uncharacterized protein (TIGR03437 family)